MALPDKYQALKQFWGSFALPAYEENTVPDDAELPYITFEFKTANIGVPLTLSAQLWYYSQTWEDINKKTAEIAAYIGYGHKILPIQGGYLYIAQGSPFAQPFPEQGNDMVRRMYINISAEFFTAD